MKSYRGFAPRVPDKGEITELVRYVRGRDTHRVKLFCSQLANRYEVRPLGQWFANEFLVKHVRGVDRSWLQCLILSDLHLSKSGAPKVGGEDGI